mgnify:CR=1 FL=1
MLPRPLLVDWSFTSRCNLACPFCRGYSRHELDRERTLALAGEIAALRPERVIIEGGEPFLRAELPEVAATIAAAGIPVTIFSNGTAVRFDWLAELQGLPVDVAVSIDADDEAAYRRARPGADLAAVWHGVRGLRQAGALSGVVITASALNLAEVLPVIERARASGAPSASVIPIKPCPSYPRLRLAPARKAELYRQIASYRETTGYPIFVDEPFFEPCFGRDSAGPLGPVAAPGAGCAFGKYLFLAADGGVAPCTFADLRVGSVAQATLAAAWAAINLDPAIAAARDRRGLGGECGRCADRERCGGCRVVSAAAAGGDLCAPDPNCPRNHSSCGGEVVSPQRSQGAQRESEESQIALRATTENENGLSC